MKKTILGLFTDGFFDRVGEHSMTLAALFLGVTAMSLQYAQAEVYPDRPIRFVVGFGAGGPTDIVARVLADQLSDSLGKKVIVENKTGASGNIATHAVATAAADGYSFLIGASPLAINETLFPDFSVKFGRDIIAVAPIGATTNVLVVSPTLNVRNLSEFIQRAQRNPGSITYATLGKGSSSHLAGVAFDIAVGTKMVPATYRGGGEALKDLLGGHIHAWFATIPSVLEAVREGRLIALATTGPERAPWLPEVPTISESGFAGYDVRLWVGVFAPAGVAPEKMRLIEEAIGRAMVSKEMEGTLANQGVAPFAMSPTEFNAFVFREIGRWRNVIDRLRN